MDIGGYTVDVLTLHDFKVDRGRCASLRMGTITLFNEIRGELQQENIILSDALIADTDARTHSTCWKREDSSNQSNGSTQRYIRKSCSAHCENAGLISCFLTVFAGGGAELLGQRLHSSEVNTIVILDRFRECRRLQTIAGVMICGNDGTLTFDMQNPRHIEAFTICLLAQPSKLGSEFVVNCILALPRRKAGRLEKIDAYGEVAVGVERCSVYLCS